MFKRGIQVPYNVTQRLVEAANLAVEDLAESLSSYSERSYKKQLEGAADYAMALVDQDLSSKRYPFMENQPIFAPV